MSTQTYFLIKKIEKIFLLCHLTWHLIKIIIWNHPASNIFSWFQRCSSYWSSTVYSIKSLYGELVHGMGPFNLFGICFIDFFFFVYMWHVMKHTFMHAYISTIKICYGSKTTPFRGFFSSIIFFSS